MEKRVRGALSILVTFALLGSLPALAQDANQNPIALCRSWVSPPLAAGWSCDAQASVDDGSWDPEGDELTLTQSPPGPYGLGNTLVTLTATDAWGAQSSCQATVRVVDLASPVVDCNAPEQIGIESLPVSFQALASDNCAVASVVIEVADCVKSPTGRVNHRRCDLTLEGDTILISGGQSNGWTTRWSVLATDESGNVLRQTCMVEVMPAPKGKRPKN